MLYTYPSQSQTQTQTESYPSAHIQTPAVFSHFPSEEEDAKLHSNFLVGRYEDGRGRSDLTPLSVELSNLS